MLIFFFKSVSDSANCFYPIKIWAEFFSQGRNMNVDISIDNKRVIVLHIVQELASS